MCGIADRLDDGLRVFVRQHHFDLYLRQEVHDVFGAAIQLGVALLSTEALCFRDGNALQADFLKGFLHFVELEGFYDRFDLFHEKMSLRFSL
ncbi:hypothetical protein D3C72_1681180 [compost metagenome]